MTSRSRGEPDVSIEIHGYAELLALHKTIMESKFHEDPDNRYILGSPIVADIANRVVDALIDLEDQAGRASKAAEWRTFRQLSGKAWIIKRVCSQTLMNQNWWNWDDSARTRYLQNAIAPFQASNDELVALRKQIDDGRGTPGQ